MNIVELTEKNFDSIIQKHPFILVDFWAKWCSPCVAFASIIKQVAANYPDFVFASVNIDEEEQLVKDFAIKSIPAIMILRNQVVVFAETGLLSKSNLIELLDQTRNLAC